jgi:hypothetical protein
MVTAQTKISVETSKEVQNDPTLKTKVGPGTGRPDEFVKKIVQYLAQYIFVKINA